MSVSANSKRRSSARVRNPEQKKAQIMLAAREEFSEHGLSGARVDEIVKSAGVNKQLLYYYFGDKENLYEMVLEQAYAELRVGEQALDLDALQPREALEEFIKYNFDFLVQNRYFVALLNDENLHKARHVKKSEQLQNLHSQLRTTIAGPLERGISQGLFKRNIDPVDLYIAISSLCFFHISNAHTLSAIFSRDLAAADEIAKRRQLVLDLIMVFLMTDSD
jgi:AcrR family transcriptional regulator